MIKLLHDRSDCRVYSLSYDDRDDCEDMASQLGSFMATLIADGGQFRKIVAMVPFRGELLALVTR